MSTRQQQKEMRKRKKRQERFKHKRAQREWGGQSSAIVVESQTLGLASMSETLTSFIEPFVDECTCAADYRGLLMFAIMAWNSTMVPPGEVFAMIEEGLNGLSAEHKQVMRATFDALVERKLTHFAENKRLILDYRLRDTANGTRLQVISAPK